MLNALRLNNGDLCIEWLVNIYETCYYVYMLGQDQAIANISSYKDTKIIT